MKNYLLHKIEFLNLPMKEIIYDFKILNTNQPTKWIKIIIHHTKNRKTIQSIIDLHVKKNNWSEIGYHFIINKNGQIIYSRSLSRAGAHCYKYNRNSIGIALLGNYDREKINEKQLKSLQNLIKELKNKYKIKEILGHNQAIYKLIQKHFWKIKLPKINPVEIETLLSYDTFIKQVTEKILEKDTSPETIRLIKRLTFCPGINLYKDILEIEKKINLIYKN